MNSFKSQDGSLDFNKMMDTAGMMMNAMNQVTGLVKGVGGIFKV
ncbi:YppG family protein [Niallia circulans]